MSEKMKYPKCGSDKFVIVHHSYNFCDNGECNTVWTSWQQSKLDRQREEIAELREGLRKLEWQNKGVNWVVCPGCQTTYQWTVDRELRKHKPGCEVANLLKGKE